MHAAYICADRYRSCSDKSGGTMSQIAIDGPAGVGKSTAAKAIAKRLNFIYVDTGAMYRAVALACLEKHIELSNERAVEECLKETSIDIRYHDRVQYIYMNDKNVSDDIRKEKVGNAASVVSKYKAVREHLVALQQRIASQKDVIMDGRDIGTKVLPNADLKIYLNASSECRAKRRYDELKAKGIECSLEDIKNDIERRDYNDMTRKESPLMKAHDAIEIDTSCMCEKEVADAVIDLFEKRKSEKK